MSEFHKGKRNKGGLRSECKLCHSAYFKTPERIGARVKWLSSADGQLSMRNSSYKCKYGEDMSVSRYDEMFAEQSGLCPLCGIEFSEENKPDVDHCHQTGQVRGLLCHRCNVALGYWQTVQNWDKDKLKQYLGV